MKANHTPGQLKAYRGADAKGNKHQWFADAEHASIYCKLHNKQHNRLLDGRTMFDPLAELYVTCGTFTESEYTFYVGPIPFDSSAAIAKARGEA